MVWNEYSLNKCHLPWVIEPKQKNLNLNEAIHLINENLPELKKKLINKGALLLRGFPLVQPEDFTAVCQTLQTGDFVDYVGGDSPRKVVAKGVYTSTEAPPYFKILLHNELSFISNYPSHIYFYCAIAPLAKGETIIADARKVFQEIDPAVKNRFLKGNLLYTSCYPPPSSLITQINPYHKDWSQVFETKDKREVEKRCNNNGFSFKWQKNGWLKISQERPAALVHPQTEEWVWFNQAHLFDLNPKFLGKWRYLLLKALYFQEHTRFHSIAFGDSTPIPKDDLYHIMDVLEKNTIYFPWQKGDVLVLDNMLTMHGRAPFKGPRRILTAMTR